MSAYFQIKTKPKHIDMKGSFTVTCNCRSSYIYECFHDLVPYEKEMAPLTPDIFNIARETVRGDIEETQASMGYWKRQRRLMEKSLGNAQNSEVFSKMLQRLEDARESIQHCEDRIQMMENALVDIRTFEDQYEENKRDWEFWIGIEGWIPGEEPEEE